MQKLHPDTIHIQTQLGNYCRTGEAINIPGVTPNRLKHYRRLVTNIINNTLEQAFPIAVEVLSKEEWEQLVIDFFSQHKSTTPQVWKLPLEFVNYVRNNDYKTKLNRPYLDDLLYFEWIEIEVHTMPDGQVPKTTGKGDLLKSIPVFNPDYRIVPLKYPVHLMPVEETLSKKGDYFLLVFRTPGDGNVHFMNLGLFHAVLLEQMISNEISLEQAIGASAQLLNLQNSPTLKEHALPFMQNIANKNFLIGYIN